MTTCITEPFVDPVTGEQLCSIKNLISVRGTGGSKFTNVTDQLLYLYYDLDGDGEVERYSLFDNVVDVVDPNDTDGDGITNEPNGIPDMQEGYQFAWKYDNSGLRLLQLRFYYDEPTNVN